MVVDEFERNRPRIEASMTERVASRFRDIRQDVDAHGGGAYTDAIEMLSTLEHEVPLIGAMTTRNFEDILALLHGGVLLEPTPQDHERVIERGLAKLAPFHRSKNSVADALIIEMLSRTRGGFERRRPFRVRYLKLERFLLTER